MTATATPSRAQLTPGERLDRYELLCPIAEGGMASVWVGRIRGKYGFEKLVAIKTILPRYAANARFREMFLDEANIAARIDHPNVAQIFDLGEERSLLYLAMEYVDGDALSKLNRACQKKGTQIPTGILMRVLADACAGLHEAHELKEASGKHLGIVHRDVSPHNVLLSTKGIVKVIDFGIARTLARDADDAEAGVLKGKIQYMAPEQALGQPIDRRADVWAVGAILYHVLAGKPPYDGPSQVAMLHLLGSGAPPPPLPAEVHPAIAAVARKALAHDAAKRYSTAAELRDAIERAMVVAQIPTTSADVSAFSMEHLAHRAQRRRDSIDKALAAANERARVGETKVLATLAGDVAAPTRPGAPPARELPATAPATSAPLVSEPPPGSSSYATIGSAELDSPRPSFAAIATRGHAVTVAAFLLGFATVTGLSMTLVRPPRTDVPLAPGSPAESTIAPVPPATSAPTPTATATPTPTPTSTPSAVTPTATESSAPRTTPEHRRKRPPRSEE